MRWAWSLLLIPIGSFSVWSGLTVFNPSLGLAPALETPQSGPLPLPEFSAVEEMYELRDRLTAAIDDRTLAASIDGGATATPTELKETLQALEIRIQIEETAQENWDQAIQSATSAVKLGKQPNPSDSTIEAIYTDWQNAVNALREISERSLLFADATDKLKQYEPNLAFASYNYDTARSDFLEPIAEKTGLPIDDVHITVCSLENECRRWHGGEPPASPASLIKVPIALALMQKVTDETISLDTKITVSTDNYTEDASDIWVGADYTLEKLLMRMINQSSNIATNQFIDYLGRDYINEVLRDRGYTKTSVNTKLVGEHTYPANAGSTPNQITTDELTEMMRQIYAQTHPGDAVLMDALASQYDTVLGYDGLRNSMAIWLGEKTGQNSKALGTTYAFIIDEKIYVSSLVLDYSANERAIRQVVNDIAKHITANGL